MKYIILTDKEELETNEDGKVLEFSSIAKAESHIRSRSKENFESAGELDCDNFGSEFAILEIKKVVVPIPSVKVSISLKEEKWEHKDEKEQKQGSLCISCGEDRLDCICEY